MMRKTITIFLLILSILLVGVSIASLVRYQVNRRKCIGCGICVDSCPTGAMTIKAGKAWIDTAKCIRCGTCQTICPVKAIFWVDGGESMGVSPEVGAGGEERDETLDPDVQVVEDKNDTSNNIALGRLAAGLDGTTDETADSASTKEVQTEDSLKSEVIRERCIGCRRCIEICPVDAIKFVRGKALIDTQKCIGCGKCRDICPMEAIIAIPE